jgi:hypothetical protein
MRLSTDSTGFCTAKPAEEKDCKHVLAGHCNGGACLNRSIVENHCCSFEAYKEAEKEVRK